MVEMNGNEWTSGSLKGAPVTVKPIAVGYIVLTSNDTHVAKKTLEVTSKTSV